MYSVFLPDAWSSEDKDLKKFTELIIERCGEIGDSSVKDNRLFHPSDEIKKYFGIE